MTAALEGGEWLAARPGRTLLPGKTQYPFYRRLVGPQGRSGRAENLVPTGIRSRTVQPVVNRYTDWANRSTLFGCTNKKEWNERCMWHTYGIQERCTRGLVGRSDGKTQLGRSGCRWEGNIKSYLQEVGWGHGHGVSLNCIQKFSSHPTTICSCC